MSREYTYDEAVTLIHRGCLNGMEKACATLEADTKLLTHVISGNLRRSWAHDVEDTGHEIIGRVGSDVEYAPIENALHPNLSQAVAADQNRIHQIIADQLQKL